MCFCAGNRGNHQSSPELLFSRGVNSKLALSFHLSLAPSVAFLVLGLSIAELARHDDGCLQQTTQEDEESGGALQFGLVFLHFRPQTQCSSRK
jgi:hypothetical protein